jgi:hypothetical protein
MHPTEDPADLTYRTFLLRWWHEKDSPATDRSAWRFSLEEVGQPPRRGFSSLQALTAFLDAELHGDDIETTDSDPVDD